MSQAATTPTTPQAPAHAGAAACAADLSKVYGEGETRVVALDSVSVEFGAAGSPRSWVRPAPASRP